jgi:hypothetical protein
MALITLPSSPQPRSMRLKLVQPAQINISEWTGRRQVLHSGRGWWECTFDLPPIVGAAAFNSWRAFIVRTRGGANEFRLPVDSQNQTTFTSVVVSGAGQTGRTLATSGWGGAGVKLLAGQFVTVNNQLLQLTADVVANSSGNATLSFEPALRVSPANGAPVEVRNPYALMYVTEIPEYSVEPGYIYALSFVCREVV